MAVPASRSVLEGRLAEIEEQIEEVTEATARARGNATDNIVSPQLAELHEEREKLLINLDAITRDERPDAKS